MQEISWYLLGYKFVWKTRCVVDLNLSSNVNAPKNLKSKDAILALEDDSQDIYIRTKALPEILRDYMSLLYSELHCKFFKEDYNAFRNISFYSFVCWYSRYNGCTEMAEAKFQRENAIFLNLRHPNKNDIIYYVRRKEP